MINIFRVLTYEISRTIRRKGFLFTTFILPLVLFGLSFVLRAFAPTPEQMLSDAQELAVQMDTTGDIIGYVDLSGAFSNVTARDFIQFPDEQTAVAALDSGEVDAVYILPEDYAETREARQIIPKVSLGQISTGPLVALAAGALAEETDTQLLMRLENPSNIATVDLTKFDEDGNPIVSDVSESLREDANFSVVYLFALLFLMSVFTGSGYLMQSVIEEKENRLIEVLITTVRPMQLLVGKVIASALMTLFQLGMWVVIGILLMRVQGDFLTQMVPFLAAIVIPTSSIAIVAVYFLLGFFMFAALFGMVGALSNSAQEGPQMTVIFALPALVPLWITTAFMTDPNGTLPVILSMIPITAPLSMIMRTVLTDVPAIQLALSIGIMLVTIVVLYWLAGRFFRVQILLSGKAPRLRDIPRLVFSKS